MPWQRRVLDVALEIDPGTGRLAYREVILTVPRQSGKTTLLLVLILLRALGSPRQSIRYTAQTGSDARKKWMDDWLPILEPSPFGRLFRARLTNGHEALLFKNGSIQGLLATTKKTGHGGSLDLGILDEAFAHPDSRLEQAVKPAMITRPQPQLWVVSTAGTPEDSPYLLGKVEAGREIAEAGLNHSICYIEYSAAEDLDPADPETWWSCMPALGYTVTEDAVASDFNSMDLSEFVRAYLNWWTAQMSDPVIPIADFSKLADRASSVVDPVVFAFDVAPDRGSSAIAVAGLRPDGLRHIEIVEHARGTKWVVPRLLELNEAQRPAAIICDPTGPAGGLLAQLAKPEHGIDATLVSAQEHAQACGMIFDAVTDATLRHLGTQELVTALDGARKRPLGDAWAWSRKSSGVDICPLVAITLAHWGTYTQLESAAPQVWDLNEIVARLRKEKAEAAGEPDPGEHPGTRDLGNGVTFHPI